MRSLLTDASLPAPPRLSPPVKGSSELLEASVSVVDAHRKCWLGRGWTGNAGTCFPAEVFLHLQVLCQASCVCAYPWAISVGD